MCSTLRIVFWLTVLVASLNSVASLTHLNDEENNWIKEKCGKSKIAHKHHSSFKIRTPPGRMAKEGQFPWVVLIRISNKRIEYQNVDGSQRQPTTTKFMFCNGIVISTKHILTAAHCLAHQIEKAFNIAGKKTFMMTYTTETVKASDVSVAMGYTTHVSNAEKVSVTKILPGTGTRAHNFYYGDADYTVIEINGDIRKIASKTKPIVPICLTDHVKQPKQGYKYILAAAQVSNPERSIAYFDKYILKKCRKINKLSTILCYQPAQAYPGDSGAPFMFYAKDKTNKERAHLHSVHFGEHALQDKKTGVVTLNSGGVSPFNTPHGGAGTMFKIIQKSINLKY